MIKLFVTTLMILSLCISNAQSKKEQIENLIISLDSLNQVVTNERQNFNITLDSLNQVLGKNQQYLEIEMASSSIEINNLNTQLDSLISTNDSINLQLKIKNHKIDSLIIQKLELLADIDLLSAPRIDRENNWTLIESNLKWAEKDNSQAVKWFNKNVFNGNKDIYTPNCYSYVMDATDYYWGYPGSIEEDEFKSKWKSIFDLKYSSFGHAFQNGNCGWASFEIRNIEFLGDLNGGDWFKLTITGGCGENDYSNTLVRLVKLTEENGSFKIANFMSLQDE